MEKIAAIKKVEQDTIGLFHGPLKNMLIMKQLWMLPENFVMKY